jgi:uncharacterized protein
MKKDEQSTKEKYTYHLTPCLIHLERNGNLLLASGARVMPFVVTTGKEVVLRAIEALGKEPSMTRGELEEFIGAELTDTLVKHHILVGKGIDEIPDPKVPPAGHKKGGMTIYFLISQGCNLACTYCFATEYKTDEKKNMPWETAQRIVDRCFDTLNPTGEVTYNFFGGEPMLNWPLVKRIIEYTEEKKLAPENAKKKVTYHITTNLTIFPDDFVEWLKKYNISILTDVDGPKEIHDALRPYTTGRGSHDVIMKNIEKLKENNIRYEVRSTITSDNVDKMDEIADYVSGIQAHGKGCVLEAVCPFEASAKVKPVEMIPDPELYMENLYRIYRSGRIALPNLNPINKVYEKVVAGELGSKVGCGTPWSNIWIVDHQGDVYSCTFLTGNPDFLVGNVFDEGEFKNYEKYVDQMLETLNVDHIERCQDCVWKYMCSGGCPAIRILYERCGLRHPKFDAYVEQMQCKLRREFYETILWDIVEAKIYEKLGKQPPAMAISAAS